MTPNTPPVMNKTKQDFHTFLEDPTGPRFGSYNRPSDDLRSTSKGSRVLRWPSQGSIVISSSDVNSLLWFDCDKFIRFVAWFGIDVMHSFFLCCWYLNHDGRATQVDKMYDLLLKFVMKQLFSLGVQLTGQLFLTPYTMLWSKCKKWDIPPHRNFA